MSAIEGLLTVLCMHERCSFGRHAVHIMLQEAEKKKNEVGMALDVATLPLILYRIGLHGHGI